MEVASSCKLLIPADIETAADVISQAFMNDPLCTFMLPSSKGRLKALRIFFRIYAEINIRNKRGYGVGEPMDGVAFWKSPSQNEVSISVKSLSIFLPLLFTAYPFGYFRARAILRKIDEMHHKYADAPHYYLDNIGVLESARGRGAASKLIRPFLARADEEKVISYTDTTTLLNVSLYSHFGFKCMEEYTVPRTGVTVWALKRPIGS
jgi:ribosomal protein S18 acetylase RimI-like enzyme